MEKLILHIVPEFFREAYYAEWHNYAVPCTVLRLPALPGVFETYSVHQIFCLILDYIFPLHYYRYLCLLDALEESFREKHLSLMFFSCSKIMQKISLGVKPRPLGRNFCMLKMRS